MVNLKKYTINLLELKRGIDLRKIKGLTMSITGSEFVLHI
jgi:hypothetical protein